MGSVTNNARLAPDSEEITGQPVDEYEVVHVLVTYTAGLYRLLTTKKQVKTLEDIKGLKIRALGGPQTDAMKALGAVPTLVPFPDVYLAMQKGVLDGTLTPIGACEIFNFHEVGNHMSHVISTR